ncbi:peptidase MA family metallohydrolase [Solirubrum puertoriconensis]|uniref:peptidase MA family metallohydrolase n=1 Tax=Solirubrum puertoriconensis TaxID=1751427 RepID=UPI00122DC652|nr:hypothetical protein [Solirubrum puertoriconensis]
MGKADSAAAAKQYTNAAALYGQAARARIEKAIELPRADDHVKAARAWATARQPDSAFNHLGSAVRLGFTEATQLRQDATLAPLHSDKRWQPLLAHTERSRQQAEHQAKLVAERTTYAGPSPEIVFTPPQPYLRQFLYNDSLPFVSVNHGNFRLYFRGNSFTAAHLAEAKQLLGEALTRSLTLLQHKAYRKDINVVFVDSKAELQALTGFSVAGGFALPGYDALFLVHSGTRRLQARHELFHLVANELWGVTNSRLLNEGAAVYADNECLYPNAVYGIAAYMLQHQKARPVAELVNNFDAAARHGEVAAYLQSAALVRYLYEQYGPEKLQHLWKAGFGEFQRIYGRSLSQFEREWRAYIRKVPAPANLDWEKLQKEGCG